MISKSVRIAALLLAPVAVVPLTATVHAQEESASVLLQVGTGLFNKGNYAGAAARLKTYVAKFSPQTDKNYYVGALFLGKAYTNLQQYENAIPAYEKASGSPVESVSTDARLSLGEAALKSKTPDYNKSVQALTQAIKGKLEPDNAAVAYYWLGQSYFFLNRFAESEDAYLRVTKDYPKATFVDDCWFGAALAAQRQNKTDVARDRFRIVADKYPNSQSHGQALLLVAQSDADGKRWKEARKGYETVLSDPKTKNDLTLTADAERGLTASLIELKDYSAAAPRLQSLMAHTATSDKEHYATALTLGKVLYLQGSYGQAASAYMEASRSSDKATAGEGAYWVGASLLADKKYAEAGKALSDMVARYPQDKNASKALLRAGDSYSAAKNSSEAMKAYQKVVIAYPNSPEALEAPKRISGEIGGLSASDQENSIGLLTASDRPAAAIQAAQGYLEKKDYPGMVRILTKYPATGVDAETQSQSQYYLGIAYEAQDKEKPALAKNAAQAYSETVRLSPNSKFAADALVRLPGLYLDQKEPANAQRAAEALLAKSPASDIATQVRLDLTQALIDQSKFEDALTVTKAILKGNPSDKISKSVMGTQAFLYEKLDRPNEAAAIYEKIANDKDNPAAATALLSVGNAKFKAGQFDAAVEKYKQVIAQFPRDPAVSDARYYLALSLYNQKKYTESATAYDNVVSSKDAKWLEESLFWSAFSYDKADKATDAITRYTTYVSQYPTGKRIEKAKERLTILKAIQGG